MRIATFIGKPVEVGAVLSVGANEVIAALPGVPNAEAVALVQAARAESAPLWFVAEDMDHPLNWSSWSASDLEDLFGQSGAGVLSRRLETAKSLLQRFPGARVGLGPWPERSGAVRSSELIALGLSRVWANKWQSFSEVSGMIHEARSAGLDPMPVT